MMRIFRLLVGALALTGAVWAQPCNQQGNAGYMQSYQAQVPHYYSTQSGFGLTSNSANSGWYSNNSCNNSNNAAWNNNHRGNRSWVNGNNDNCNSRNNRWNSNRYQNQGRYQRQNRTCGN